ncbi:MAG: D-glycero-beta-D-manno-heptose 1-phosphate adenylyltransferase [Microcoleaceae cyanobacterium]
MGSPGSLNFIFVYSLEELQQAIATNPTAWRPLVLTNGCFDLLHAGHVRYLQAAKALGRSLVVGLNSDQSVQTIKPAKPGQPPRPIIPQEQRAEVLAALKPVDAVVIFSEPTATQLIEHLKPDIYVKGGDYTVETLPEAPAILAYGGEIALIQFEVPSSTSAIVNQILQTSQQGFEQSDLRPDSLGGSA